MSSSLEKLNIGIIGCGRISDLHYPGYADNPHARVYAVCDSDESAAQRKKNEWWAEKCFTDYRELLQDPGLDAVEILTPQKLHEPMVIAAAKAGKHIALQKPMTISLKCADVMLAAAKSSGVVFRISDNYLFYPPVVQAKTWIDQGRIGNPTNIRVKMISGGEGGWTIPATAWEWRLAEKEAGRGLQTFDHGHHIWAVAWYLLGSIERVSAWIDTLDGIVDSPAVVMWKHADGVRYGMCEYAFAPEMHIPSKYYANDEWIEITGTKGMILIHRCTGEINKGPALSLFDGHDWDHRNDIESDWASGFEGATQNFIRAVRGEEKPLLSGEEGREILKIDLAIAKSARVRREVYVDELDSPVPWLYTRRQVSRERRKVSGHTGIFERFKPGFRDQRHAAKADPLTQTFVDRFDPQEAGAWEATIGLLLLPEGGTDEIRYGVSIRNGGAVLTKGAIPEDADVVLKIPAGTWAAVLLKKKRIETALIQGRLKVEGKAELALKLRKVFGL